MKYKGKIAPIKYCKTGKPIYDKKTAITAKNKRYRDAHEKLRIYHCPECNGWHLSSSFYEGQE